MSRFDNPVYSALRETDYDWDDASLVRTALRNVSYTGDDDEGPVGEEGIRFFMVLGAGMLLGWAGGKAALPPLALGAAAYVAGYYVRAMTEKS